VFGPIIQFLKDPLELIRKGYHKVGACFKVNFLAMNMVYLIGPEGQEWFFTKDRYLDQAKMYKFTVPIFGKGLLYDVDYATRTAQLHFIRQRLTDQFLRSYTETLEEEVMQFFDECWPGMEGTVDIRDSMQILLTRTSVRCLMGSEMRRSMENKKDGNSIVDLLAILEKGMLPLSVFCPGAPIARHRARDEARKKCDVLFKEILAQRRQNSVKENDFLQSLLDGNYPDGRAITDEEIVGFLIAAFFGGMHNSSITTAWATLEIFSRPELARKLLEEQQAALGSDAGHFTFEGYQKMSGLKSTLMEVLRLHPPLYLLMRTVLEDVKFKDYTIRKGSVVCVSPNVCHELDEYFPNAKTFDAERFPNGPLTPKAENYWAYVPFGGGRRFCKGMEFGYLQIMCALSCMMRNFDIELVDGVTKPTPSEDGVVIAMEQPCRVHYKRKILGTATPTTTAESGSEDLGGRDL